MWEIFAWIFLVIGGIFLFALVAHIEVGKSFSVPFTVISIIILSVCLGLGIQFLLLYLGL
ncbi:MAG TPA: hypothetical protein VKK79_02160 [Candidatus Lokiarchaeia archaeon]|nr:hypothetical protein [Candidatus Lokiarchaeia archaeon]